MTAEICVMNRHGISIAADSAVTMRNGSNTKVFDSAEKIFTLSKKYPVGVMIYGRSDYLGNPLEILIKEYRDRKINKKFDYVRDWGSDFLKFVNTFMSDYYEKEQISQLEKNEILKKIFEVIDEVVNEFKYNKLNIQEESGIKDLGKAFIYFLKKKDRLLAKAQNVDRKSFESDERPEYIQFARDKLKQDLVAELYHDEQADVIIKIVETVMLGNNFNIPGVIGIVVMGYGDKEIYPNLIGYRIKGQYKGDTLYEIERETKISPLMPTASIDPFAQVDVVNTFIRGISDGFVQDVHKVVDGENTELIKQIHKDVDPETAEKVKKLMEKNNDIVHNRIQQYLDQRKSNYSSPLINMVALLPKDELSSLSEALVSITSLKRRVSSDDNTVGGPIDVAMITRSEGFVWIKRKHYFSSELNHSFFSNYFNDKGE